MANLSLPEIFVQLPEDIQIALERGLEGSKLPSHPTRDQVLTATTRITDDLKDAHNASYPVCNLLDQVPHAVADLLF